MKIIPEQPTRLRLVPISKLAAAPKWQLETMRALREPLFLWITNGQGRITIGARTRGFHPHNAIFIPAGTLHGMQALTRVQGTAIYFGARHGLELPETALHLRLRDASQHAEVSQLVDYVQREVEGQRPKADQAAYHQLGLLAIWLDRHNAAHQGENAAEMTQLNANERLTARYAALLEREFGSSLNVTDYATALGVTPTHLTRACRASCGRTALDMIQTRRLYEARKLLMETDIPVQDIARNLGFSTPSYFSRAFSLQIGQPPSSYRKVHEAKPRLTH
ncbi:helix-turn-helix transcriptional regulator [Roseinatronobacter monicus]|uniref:AraC family transcriptional regulator n=1 Tax=Roseinatronobacter monicus TaxID=393481 RepID=A0A543KBM6_9RHOB|nr:helix-turn-helix domain-containing protein [Roseinatronobacter monicus]TQM92488.1 AraC family transcriptional regulator [Roseinatronobacter monicus]